MHTKFLLVQSVTIVFLFIAACSLFLFRCGLIVASLRHNSLKVVVLLFILNIIVQGKKISSSSLDRDWFIIFWAKVATKWLPGGDARSTFIQRHRDLNLDYNWFRCKDASVSEDWKDVIGGLLFLSVECMILGSYL